MMLYCIYTPIYVPKFTKVVDRLLQLLKIGNLWLTAKSNVKNILIIFLELKRY